MAISNLLTDSFTLNVALSIPTHSNVQATSATIGCTSSEVVGTYYAATRNNRQWYSVANGDSQTLEDEDVAIIISQVIGGEVTWADSAAVTDTSLQELVDSIPVLTGQYVGWVQEI
jgi:hypothetical protein